MNLNLLIILKADRMGTPIDIRSPAKKIHLILILGILFGITDYMLSSASLVHAILFHVFTVLVIGFSLVIVAYNKAAFLGTKRLYVQLLLLPVLFVFIRLAATELEIIFQTWLSVNLRSFIRR